MSYNGSNSIHDRIVQISITCDESDDSVLCTAVKYYRDRSVATPLDIDFTAGAAGVSATPHEIKLSTYLPPPTIITIKPTFQA